MLDKVKQLMHQYLYSTSSFFFFIIIVVQNNLQT